MARADATARCVSGPDLTAFAHGELPEWRRAEVSRHLLRCESCRDEVDADRAVLGRLGDLGRGGEDWRSQVAAAAAEIGAARRARRRAVFAAAAVAAAVVAGFLLLPGTLSGRNESTPSVPTADGSAAAFPSIAGIELPRDEATLLGVQQMDGRFTVGDARRDAAATSLAVAALASRRGGGLGDDTVAEAIRAGADWILLRQETSGRLGSSTPDGSPADRGLEHALATSALLEVYAATHDPALRGPIDLALRFLGTEDRADLSGDSALQWARRTLLRARGLGWERLDDAIARVSAWAGHGDPDGWLAAAPPCEETVCPMTIAMKILRESTRG